MRRPIYLDSHSTTPCDPRVVEAMSPYWTDLFGNAGSKHSYGVEALRAVEKARDDVAALVGAKASEIVFTSGATEANNLALLGVLRTLPVERRSLITFSTEHSAILDPAQALKREGVQVQILPVDPLGRIRMEEAETAITDRTGLVSVMLANNEIGTIQSVAQVAKLAKEKGVVVHCDAVQAVGKIPVDIEALGVDLLSISAHKFYGPKGVGALVVRKTSPRIRIEPLVFGGGHEKGLRSGTLAVPLIVGLGEACRLAHVEMREESIRVSKIRDDLEARLKEGLVDAVLNGDRSNRLPNNLSLSIPGVRGDILVDLLKDEVALSTGATCSSVSIEPSHVLKAIGHSDELALGTLRFGLGRWTTAEDVRIAAEKVMEVVNKLRKTRS